MNPPAPTTPSLPPSPVGMGDWFDSSWELQCGLKVIEWHLPGWEALAAEDAPATPPTRH